MKKGIRVLVYILCILTGSIINGAIISIGYKCIPPPQGFNMNDPLAFKNAVSQMQALNFVFPFLAHALGTWFASWIWSSLKQQATWMSSLGIAGVFFCGGLYMAIILDAPIAFECFDLVYAYFPMAILGYLCRIKTFQRL